jgi:hypothetical protein
MRSQVRVAHNLEDLFGCRARCGSWRRSAGAEKRLGGASGPKQEVLLATSRLLHSTPLPRQDAYMIVYHLEDLEGLEYWEEAR